jgi:membrane protease subunit (stomatin/prohibitin family)
MNQLDIFFEGQQGDVIWRSSIENLYPDTKIYSRVDCSIIILKNSSFVGLFDDTEEYYTLKNANQTFLQKLFSGKKEAQKCDIYYINRFVELENKWGTPTRIDIYDKDYDIFTSVGASGSYRFSVKNPLTLFSKVQGYQNQLDQESVRNFFRNELNVEIRNQIATFFLEFELGIKDLALVTTLEKKVSENIFNTVKTSFESYGLYLNKFLIHQFIMEEEFIQQINQIKKQAILNNLKQDTIFEDRIKHAKNEVEIHRITKDMQHENKEEDREDFKVISEAISKINQSNLQQSNESEVKKKFCSNCGDQVSFNDKFCSNCGNKVA